MIAAVIPHSRRSLAWGQMTVRPFVMINTNEQGEQSAYADHHCDGVVWFDYDKIDEALGHVQELPPDAQEMTAEALARILAWVFGNKHGGARTSLLRLVAFGSSLRPDLLDNRTYDSLAAELGVTKQNLSHAALKCSHELGIKFARSRPATARENMSKAAAGHPCYNGRKKNHAG